MSCADNDSDDAALELGTPPGPKVRLWNRTGDPMTICVQLAHAPSLMATSHDLTVGLAEEPLSTFLTRIAEDATDKKTRTWKNQSNTFQVTAEHIPDGHTDLTWTLRAHPDSMPRNPRSTSVTMRVKAGEEMHNLAAAVQRFLTPGAPTPRRPTARTEQ